MTILIGSMRLKTIKCFFPWFSGAKPEAAMHARWLCKPTHVRGNVEASLLIVHCGPINAIYPKSPEVVHKVGWVCKIECACIRTYYIIHIIYVHIDWLID